MKINLWFEYVLYFFITAIFVVIPSAYYRDVVDPTQNGKFLFFAYITITSIVIYIHTIDFDSFHFKVNLLDICFAGYIIYVVIIKTISEQTRFSTNYYELILLFFLYGIIKTQSNKFHSILLSATVLGGILQALHGFLQLHQFLPSFNSNFLITGSFFNPGPYSGYLAIIFVISIGLIVNNNSSFANLSYLKPILYLSLILLIVILPAARSRAAIISMVFGAVFVTYLSFKEKIQSYKITRTAKIVLIIILTLLVFISIFFLYISKRDSSNGRLLIWNVSLQMIKQHPLLGTGYDNFKSSYMLNQANYFDTHPNSHFKFLADNTNYAFNEILQNIIENGLLSLLFFTTGLYAIFKISNKNLNVMIAKGVVICIFLFSLFSYPFQILPIKICLILSLAIISSSADNDFCFWKVNKVKNRYGRVAFYISIWVIFYISITKIYFFSKQLVIWNRANIEYNSMNLLRSTESYKSVYPFFSNDGEFLMNYGKALSVKNDDLEAIHIFKKAKVYLNNTVIQTGLAESQKRKREFKQSEINYKIAISMTPGLLIPKYLLLKFYQESNQKYKSVLLAKEIISMPVKVKSDASREILVFANEVIKKHNN